MEFDNLLKHDQELVKHMQAQLADSMGIESDSIKLWYFKHADGTTGLNMALGYPLASFWVPVIEDGKERDVTFVVGCDNDECAFRVDPPGNSWPAKLEATYLLPENEQAFSEWNDNYDVPAKRLQQIDKLRKAGKYDEATTLEGSLKCEVYTSLGKGDAVQFRYKNEIIKGHFKRAYVYTAKRYPQSEAGPMPMVSVGDGKYDYRVSPEAVEAL